MGKIKVLLVGICEYPVLKYPPLPFCKNDLYVLQDALVKGLKVDIRNISMCGKNGMVTISELLNAFNIIFSNISEEDTFIFYFSGHGGKNSLALSDGLLELQSLIDWIEKFKCKNKIIILDSCHSGSFSINSIPQIEVTEMVENFAGHGYAVLASCSSEQFSGFNEEKKISLYTSFLCEALTSKYLVKKGKKSLEVINESIFRLAEMWNSKIGGNIQQPIFRTNMGGTIFFDVEEYHPYKVNKVYEETEEYIIYEVKPLHHGTAKRLCANVILRFKSSLEQIAEISTEIKNKVMYYEVHQNQIAETHHKGKPANIVWCHFGYDEDDMVDSNFYCFTTWVDDLQDKNWWYRNKQNTKWIRGVHIESNNSYDMIKDLKDNKTDKKEFIRLTREYTSKMISVAEKYIKVYREYLNNSIEEQQLIDILEPFNSEISLWYFKQSELPIAPNELHKWSQTHSGLCATIHDFSLFYNKNNLNHWSTENRKWLMKDSIKRYGEELEELKEQDKIIENNT